MTKLLLVSATEPEIGPTLDFLKTRPVNRLNNYQLSQLEVEVCITGVGMSKTAFALGSKAHKGYQIAVNAGLAGAFSQFVPGELVQVREDCFSELGAQDDLRFLDIDSLGLGEQRVSLTMPLESPCLLSIPFANGITVNTVHGNTESIKEVEHRTHAQVESMEGAAFIMAASQSGWKALQLRAISNRVEKRNRDNWKIQEAVQTLNKKLIELLLELSSVPIRE